MSAPGEISAVCECKPFVDFSEEADGKKARDTRRGLTPVSARLRVPSSWDLSLSVRLRVAMSCGLFTSFIVLETIFRDEPEGYSALRAESGNSAAVGKEDEPPRFVASAEDASATRVLFGSGCDTMVDDVEPSPFVAETERLESQRECSEGDCECTEHERGSGDGERE